MTMIERRSVLRAMGLGLASAALPGRFVLAADAISPVMRLLSEYMGNARQRPLPADVVEKAKDHILDTFAAMLSGAELPPAKAAFAFARDYNTDRTATIVGSRMTASPLEAALINGMLAHSDETDDSHASSQSHPGCAMVPAALAAGEKFGIDGAHFLRAVTLGYDIGPRMTMSFGGLAFRNSSHKSTHAIAGTFGAAAAAGCAASLERAADALAARLHGAAVLRHRRVEPRYRAHREGLRVRGHARAQRHRRPRCWSRPGSTASTTFSPESTTFFEAYAPAAKPEVLIEKLGERYEITRTNIKKWTVGSPIQAPLDAHVQHAASGARSKADEVREVVRAPVAQRGEGGGQPRDARHLDPAHGRRHADGWDGFVRGRA